MHEFLFCEAEHDVARCIKLEPDRAEESRDRGDLGVLLIRHPDKDVVAGGVHGKLFDIENDCCESRGGNCKRVQHLAGVSRHSEVYHLVQLWNEFEFLHPFASHRSSYSDTLIFSIFIRAGKL